MFKFLLRDRSYSPAAFEVLRETIERERSTISRLKYRASLLGHHDIDAALNALEELRAENKYLNSLVLYKCNLTARWGAEAKTLGFEGIEDILRTLNIESDGVIVSLKNGNLITIKRSPR